MTPLRAKMIRELELHRKSPNTIEAYVTAVAQLAQHFGRSPEQIAVEEVRDFLHYLITERKVAFSTCNQKLCGIVFFYRHVLGQDGFSVAGAGQAVGPAAGTAQPRSEIARLVRGGAAPQAAGAADDGLWGRFRVSELVRLQPPDIHAERMLIRIDQGKGRKDRYTLLSPRLLEELRAYWREYRPQTWLFEGAQAGPAPGGGQRPARSSIGPRRGPGSRTDTAFIRCGTASRRT